MNHKLIFLAVLALSCGGSMTNDAGSGGGSGGGSVTGGGAGGGSGGGGGRIGLCDTAPAFIAADLAGKAGFDPGSMMSPPFNFATFTRASAADAGRVDVMFNEFYAAAPLTNAAIPALSYRLCNHCFVIQTHCNSTGGMCSKIYLAQSGTVSVSAATKDVDAGSFAFTLSNVTYQAWDFGSDTAVDGGCLTLPSFTFSGAWP